MPHLALRPWAPALLLGLAPLLACRAPAPEPARGGLSDHHVHLLGPRLLADWKALGVTFSRPDAAYASLDGWFERPAADAAPIDTVVAVPMAHLYGNEEFRGALGLSLEAERAGVRAENEHVAREAARWPGRATALASVDPLRPYALEELEHMRARGGIAGVKIHLASAGFDFRDASHLEALERVAAWAEDARLWMLLHLDPQRRGTEVEDVRHLLERTLGPHPDLTVVIAHCGGSGGFGPWTRSVLATLTDWLEREAERGYPRPRTFVDLAAVPMIRESEGVPASSPEECAALAPALRRLGLQRVVFGSDFPVFDPREHARFLAEACGFTPAELRPILARRLPSAR